MWDVHGGYTDALTKGPQEFWFLRDEAADLPDEVVAKGLARLGDERPSNLREVTLEELVDEPPDVVLAQRPIEVDACARLRSRGQLNKVGAVYVEHNTPKGGVPDSRHFLADQQTWLLVHVTHFNRLFWECGTTPTAVIEHGLPDPGYRYTGSVPHLGFVVNEPVRRWRTTGTDLLTHFGDLPIDAFGIDGQLLPAALAGHCPQLRFGGNLKPDELATTLAARRAYLHVTRWTSLGLSLIEAMLLGLPVLALETTEAARAVPRSAGERSTDIADLVQAAHRLLHDPDAARECGHRGRAHALQHYGLQRFLSDWTACWQRAAR